MNHLLDEAADLLDQIGHTCTDPTVAINALAAAAALARSGARTHEHEPNPGRTACTMLDSALVILGELARNAPDDDVLLALELTLMAQIAAR